MISLVYLQLLHETQIAENGCKCLTNPIPFLLKNAAIPVFLLLPDDGGYPFLPTEASLVGGKGDSSSNPDMIALTAHCTGIFLFLLSYCGLRTNFYIKQTMNKQQ